MTYQELFFKDIITFELNRLFNTKTINMWWYHLTFKQSYPKNSQRYVKNKNVQNVYIFLKISSITIS